MMKNSTLLKWTNIKNNKNNKNANKNWLHQPEALQGGHVVYLVKFLGETEVSQPKGIEVVKEAIRKLRFNQQIRKSEGSKTPKVELTISIDGVAIQQPKTKKIEHQYPLHRISYCADDKAEKRFFSFIAKEADSEAHSCFVFISDKLAEEITLTIGQAFDLAYRKFLDTSNREIELRKQVTTLQNQLLASQSENSNLKDRLRQVGALEDGEDVHSFSHTNGIDEITIENEREDTVEEFFAPTQTRQLPPIPPRNSVEVNLIDRDILFATESDDDDDDFDPRADESMINVGGGHQQNAADDDDFDPRADEHQSIPHLIPPPRPTRPQDKIAQQDPFSSTDILDQFNEMKVGFSRGLSFGTTDSAADFSLESLDPLRN